jgi:hypothetical protein
MERLFDLAGGTVATMARKLCIWHSGIRESQNQRSREIDLNALVIKRKKRDQAAPAHILHRPVARKRVSSGSAVAILLSPIMSDRSNKASSG